MTRWYLPLAASAELDVTAGNLDAWISDLSQNRASNLCEASTM